MFILSSCYDDLAVDNQIDYENENISIDENSTNQKAFAKILSKAVYNEEAMRSFIKEEALLQVDRDYDVFYPFINSSFPPFPNHLIIRCFPQLSQFYLSHN